MAEYKFIAYNINDGNTVSGYTYKTYKEVFEMVTETILPMSIVEKVEITLNGKVIEELIKDEKKMTEKIKISKELNEWLEKYPTLDTNKQIYARRFGKEVFDELIDKVFANMDDTDKYYNLLTAFGLDGNSKAAHLWLIMNRDKWEVEQEELFYICIPEADGYNGYLGKKTGIEFFSRLPHSDNYKWTQEEMNKHEVAKHLQYFIKIVEKN